MRTRFGIGLALILVLGAQGRVLADDDDADCPTTGVPEETRNIVTVAGIGNGDGSPATIAQLSGPRGIAFDGAGNLYIADTTSNRIRRVVPGADGMVTGAADEIMTTVPGTVTMDTQGNGARSVAYDARFRRLYFCEFGGNLVRAVEENGTISVVATAPLINGPVALTVDVDGNLYISEFNVNRVRKIAHDGATEIVAGGGINDPSTGGLATNAKLAGPAGLLVDNGILYIAENTANRVLMVDAAKQIHVLATGLNLPSSFARFGDGLFFSETGANRVRRLDLVTGAITFYIGATGFAPPNTDPPLFSAPRGLAFDGGGNLFVGVSNSNRVVRVTPGGAFSTVAGSSGYSGEDVPAALSSISGPLWITVDGKGNVFFNEGTGNRTRVIDQTTGLMKTVAGNGGTLYNGDDQPAKNATMLTPAGLLYDAGTMYITEANGQRVRRVNLTTGIISRVAGNGTPGSAGDNGPALDATVNIPLGMNADADSIYWAEGGGNRIRRLERATGKIFTYVGSGGTYVPSPPLANPRVVAFDPSGNLYTAEFQGQSIRKVPLDANQPAVVVAGTFGAPGFDGDGGPADKAHLFAPVGVFEDAGFLYISDFSNHRVRRVAVDKTISTYVGGGEAGDGGPATATRLVWPGATLIDNDNLYISEYLGGQRVRRLNVATPLKLSPGTLNLESNGSSVTACIQLPEGRDAWNVNVASVRLQAVSPADGMLRPSPGHQVLQIAAAATPVARIDSDGDGMADQLVVKFDRSEIARWATGAGELSLRIEGQFAPTKANSPIGTYFSGDTKIRTK